MTFPGGSYAHSYQDHLKPDPETPTAKAHVDHLKPALNTFQIESSSGTLDVEIELYKTVADLKRLIKEHHPEKPEVATQVLTYSLDGEEHGDTELLGAFVRREGKREDGDRHMVLHIKDTTTTAGPSTQMPAQLDGANSPREAAAELPGAAGAAPQHATASNQSAANTNPPRAPSPQPATAAPAPAPRATPANRPRTPSPPPAPAIFEQAQHLGYPLGSFTTVAQAVARLKTEVVGRIDRMLDSEIAQPICLSIVVVVVGVVILAVLLTRKSD